jgi:hypothetical protein
MQFVAPAIPLLGIAGYKFYQNTVPEERSEKVQQVRQNTLAERFTQGGADSRISRMGDKQFEKFIKTNSVGKSCEGKLRLHRTASQVGVNVPEEAIGA